MSLVERTLPVVFHRNFSFFDNVFSGMSMEVDDFHHDMQRMRERMFQLVPFNDKDTTVMNMDVQRPIIEERGQSKLHLKFDVGRFKPEEVKVKMVGGNMLQVSAEHHEKKEGSELHRVFCRQFSLPKGVDGDKVMAEVSRDGVLTVEGPAPPLSPNEKMIPITYKH